MGSDTSDASDILTRWRHNHPVGYRLLVVLTAFSVGVAATFTGVTLAVDGVPDTPLDEIGGGTAENRNSNPTAGVTFDQESTDAVGEYNVSVQVVSLENANHVTVKVDEADGTEPRKLDSVGDVTTLTGLEGGDVITVIGSLNGNEAVIQTYRVGD